MVRATAVSVVWGFVVLLVAGCGTPSSTAPAKTVAAETVSVTASPPQAAPDGSVRSQLLPLALPAGTKAACCGHYDGMEVWSAPASYAYNVQSLREQLPINREYLGLPWCMQQINGRLGLTEWFWSSTGDTIGAHVSNDGTITLDKGPDPQGREGCGDALVISRGLKGRERI